MKKFQDKYRIPSARASWWDYSWNGLYFITICTAGRENYFGRITAIVETQDFASPDRSPQDLALPDPAFDKNQIEPEICVKETQDIASLHQIRSIPNNSRGYKKMQLTPLGEMALKCWMDIPKHFPFVKLDAFMVMPNHVHGILEIDKPGFDNHMDFDVETQDFASPHRSSRLPNSPCPKNKFGPQSKNLASILRGYKTGVTNFAVANNFDFGWQARYYDHIIRDDQEYIRISDYIVENPEKWDEDEFFRN